MRLNETAVKRAIKNSNYTQETLAIELGMKSRQGFLTLFTRKAVKTETIEKICKLLNVDISEITMPDLIDDVNKLGNIIHVPLIAYGGFLHGYSNKVFLNALDHFNLPGIQGEHFAFEVDGMSMYDLVAPGDMAIARPEEKLDWMIKGKMYVLQTIDGLLIKLFDKILDGKAYFHSYNKEYDGIQIPLKNLKRIYFVSRILKKP